MNKEMYEINNDNIEEAIKTCIKNKMYKCLIALSEYEKIKSMFNHINLYLTDNDLIHKIGQARLGANGAYITLENKSEIRIIVANQNSRGHKVNRVVYDKEIDADIVKYILPFVLVNYIYGEPE